MVQLLPIGKFPRFRVAQDYCLLLFLNYFTKSTESHRIATEKELLIVLQLG